MLKSQNYLYGTTLLGVVLHKPTTEKAFSPSQLSLEEIVYLSNSVGLEYIEAKRVSDELELMKPTHRARSMNRHDDGRNSEVKLRRLAEIDPEYLMFLQQLSAAKAKSDRLRIRYDSYKSLFEAKRSMLSYKKAEMGLI
jgi:hypothetical protein